MLEESQMQFPTTGVEDTKNQQNAKSSVLRKEGQFYGEEIPEFCSEQKMDQSGPEQSGPSKFKGRFFIDQDPIASKLVHSKLMALEKISCLITTLIFFLSCSKTEMDIITTDPSKITSMYIMYTLSACTALLVIVITLRYICLFELQVRQNKVYLKRQLNQGWLTAFFKSNKVKFLLLQILIILPHPLAGLQKATYQLFQTYDFIFINHSYNDALSLMLILKFYIIIRSLVSITKYASPKSSRLCSQHGFQHNILYSMKCILRDQPLTTIAILFGMFMILFGYGLKLSEGTLGLYNPGLITGFQGYENCFWLVFITMSTVGYGDYFPKTLVGRCLIIVTAITGVLLTSLLIVSLSIYLEMGSSQSKSHSTLERLTQQSSLMDEASKTLAQTIKIHKVIANPLSHNQQELKSKFLKLKSDIDAVKDHSHRVKSIRGSDNVVEEMNRLFSILKEKLKDIFLGQKRLRQQISKIKETQSIKTSFIKEIGGILEKKEGDTLKRQ